MNGPAPTAITLHQASRRLEIAYDDHAVFSLPFEYLRVHSPSAEVQGHSPDQAVLQLGKEKRDHFECPARGTLRHLPNLQ